MGRFFSINVDLEELTDAMHQFITEPTPRRNDLPIVKDLDDINPEAVEVMECMALDGTEDRSDVSAYVKAVFGRGAPVITEN